MTAAPLGALAEVILEQYGEVIQAAVNEAVKQRVPGLPPDCNVVPESRGEVFRSDELASRHIQPGNWVAVGRIVAIQMPVLIEINLSTGEWRETPEPVELSGPMIPPVDESTELPATVRQAAS